MEDRVARPPEPAAFVDFARRVEPRLRYALAGCFNNDQARDATQEALVYAWKHWDKVEGLANPGGYLYTLAKRWGWRQRKRSMPLHEFGIEDPPPVEPGLPQALGRLSTMQRQAVYLVEGLGMTQQEVADLLGVSRTTVQTHLERALNHLRKELGVTIDE